MRSSEKAGIHHYGLDQLASVFGGGRSSVVVSSTSSATGAGRKVVVPNLVDDAEDLAEVMPLSTADTSQHLVDDVDDDFVDPAAFLVQMLRMERSEALFLCAFPQSPTIGASQVGGCVSISHSPGIYVSCT